MNDLKGLHCHLIIAAAIGRAIAVGATLGPIGAGDQIKCINAAVTDDWRFEEMLAGDQRHSVSQLLLCGIIKWQPILRTAAHAAQQFCDHRYC